MKGAPRDGLPRTWARISRHGKSTMKPLPRAYTKLLRQRQDRREVEAIKREIRARDHHECRCCNRRNPLEVHEHKRRGAGGDVSLVNSFTLCRACHSLIQTRHIQVEMADGLTTFDANFPLRFLVPKDIAKTLLPVYVPAQVTVVDDEIGVDETLGEA